MSTNSLLEVRFGVSPGEAGKSAPGTGGPGMLELYGIPGLPTDPRFAGGLTNQNVSGWTSWGRQNSNPQFQDPWQTIDNYFNKDNVVIPTDRSRPFGNAPRNAVRASAFYQLDLGLHKSFNLPWEDKRLEFRAEFFNALNKTNFGAANGNRSSADFGTIRSTFPARQIQLGLKFYF